MTCTTTIVAIRYGTDGRIDETALLAFLSDDVFAEWFDVGHLVAFGVFVADAIAEIGGSTVRELQRVIVVDCSPLEAVFGYAS
jgi:hypothetical protein